MANRVPYATQFLNTGKTYLNPTEILKEKDISCICVGTRVDNLCGNSKAKCFRLPYHNLGFIARPLKWEKFLGYEKETF